MVSVEAETENGFVDAEMDRWGSSLSERVGDGSVLAGWKPVSAGHIGTGVVGWGENGLAVVGIGW